MSCNEKLDGDLDVGALIFLFWLASIRSVLEISGPYTRSLSVQHSVLAIANIMRYVGYLTDG